MRLLQDADPMHCARMVGREEGMMRTPPPGGGAENGTPPVCELFRAGTGSQSHLDVKVWNLHPA